tara:strand:+ start:264 stop:485 length:222 start_codon:yes stop_codon:yes gene_type:complete
MIENMIKALNKGKVAITFESMVSGRKIEDIYTLKGVNLPQNPENNKLVVLHCDSNTYEDIEKKTILEWVSYSS